MQPQPFRRDEVGHGAIGLVGDRGAALNPRQVRQEGPAVDRDRTLHRQGKAVGIHREAEVGGPLLRGGGDQGEGLVGGEAAQLGGGDAIDAGHGRIAQQLGQLDLGKHPIAAGTAGEGDHIPAGLLNKACRKQVPDAVGGAVAVGVAGAVEVGVDLILIALEEFV